MAARIGDSENATPGSYPTVSPKEARQCLEAILSSELFRQSPRLCGFLRHVVERTLSGHTDAITEYALALEVFDRPESFDSRLDSIVRVSASQLRKKLAQYYDTLGREDPIRLELPVPGYQPHFVRQHCEASEVDSSRPIWWVAGVGFATVTLLLLAWVFWGESASADRPVVAVLPLRALSPDPEAGLLAESYTQALTTELSRLQNISILSHTAAVASREPLADSRRFELDYFLEGAVARAGDRLWLTARLTAVGNQRLVWGESFERQTGHSLQIQAELSKEIADQIGGVLGSRGLEAPRQARTVPQDYILGKAFLLQWNPPSLIRSAECFGRAIQDDPGFAPAYAGYAMALRILSFMAPGTEPDGLARAREAGEKALALDDSLAEAHAAVAGAEIFDHNWEAAERRFLHALELDPEYAHAHHMYGLLALTREGRFEEARLEMRRALELEPLSIPSHLALGYILHVEGRNEEAISQFEKTLELAPKNPAAQRFLAQVHLALGNTQKAIELLTLAYRKTDGLGEMGLLAYAQAVSGHKSDALELLRNIQSRLPEAESNWSLAVAFTGLGKHDDAMDHLLKAIELHDVWALHAAVDPLFVPLRKLPDFDKVRVSLGVSPPAK